MKEQTQPQSTAQPDKATPFDRLNDDILATNNYKIVHVSLAAAKAEHSAHMALEAAAKLAADKFAAKMRSTDHSGEVTLGECVEPDDVLQIAMTVSEWEAISNTLAALEAIRQKGQS